MKKTHASGTVAFVQGDVVTSVENEPTEPQKPQIKDDNNKADLEN